MSLLLPLYALFALAAVGWWRWRSDETVGLVATILLLNVVFIGLTYAMNGTGAFSFRWAHHHRLRRSWFDVDRRIQRGVPGSAGPVANSKGGGTGSHISPSARERINA